VAVRGRGKARMASAEQSLSRIQEGAAVRIQAVFRGYRVRAEREREFWRGYAEVMYSHYSGCEEHDLVGCAECAFRASGRCPSELEEGGFDDDSWGGPW
jgi:hypothetical protein